MAYKVLADEALVPEAVNETRDPLTGEPVGYTHRASTYFKDEVLPDEKVSPVLREALEDEDHRLHAHASSILEKVGGTGKERLDVARRLGLPFDDYDSLSEEDVIAAFRVLSSPVISVIKEYEAQRDEPRTRILEYDAGRREAQDDRARGDAGLVSERQDADTDKPVNAIRTREVNEDGTVTPGEGYTGTGGPGREPGAAARSEEPKKGTRRTRTTSRTSGDSGDDDKDNRGGGGS